MFRTYILLSVLLGAEATSLSTLSSKELRDFAASRRTDKGDDPGSNQLNFYGTKAHIYEH